ncbi:BPSL0761 family protein [Hydrogenophaga taeniospiralis]|uniref:BPSL0761 family protein n=1 Tax=Hydrogenophaga taeniospiralis TaxID=65656 RepID=UPI001CF935DE|nr:BPSL0761 family protein [Hydrogenophaga taeniospiralis]UCU93345.1 hypothetical protein KI616_21540 [Hydrogenophaga taeniospiralis]
MIMTLPDERARAHRFSGEILREMQFRTDVPEDLKRRVRVTLRHYPEPVDLLRMIETAYCIPRSCLDQHWLAPEPNARIGGNSGSRKSGQADLGSS